MAGPVEFLTHATGKHHFWAIDNSPSQDDDFGY